MFLTGMVAMIILRTLKRDITSYNAEEDTEVTWIILACNAARGNETTSP